MTTRDSDNLEVDSVSNELHRALERLLESGTDEPLHSAFLARATKALAEVNRQLTEEGLREAASASSDVGSLVAALMASDLDADEVDAELNRARLRGIQARRELLEAEGGPLGVSEVATILDVSRQAVHQRRKRGNLLAVETGRHGYRYPAWQFAEGGTIDGLERALDALEDHDPWMTLRFFLGADPRLDGDRPLDRLRAGDVDAVLEAADRYGHHGAD